MTHPRKTQNSSPTKKERKNIKHNKSLISNTLPDYKNMKTCESHSFSHNIFHGINSTSFHFSHFFLPFNLHGNKTEDDKKRRNYVKISM
jgi:hypothetical protein